MMADRLVDLGVAHGQRRREPQRRRRHRVHDEPGVEQLAATTLASRPGRARRRAAARDRARPRRRRVACSAGGEALAGPLGQRGGVDRLHLGEHRSRRRGGERLAAEGGGVVAGLEGGGDVARGPSTRRSGTPLPSALAIVTTSGTTPKCWKPNHRPVRPRPVCTSSTMNRTPRSSHSAAHALEVLGRRRVHAALALHGLEQHGRHRRVERARSSASRSSHGDVAEALGQRLERLVLLRLAGGVQRGQRAAVERAVGADDDVACRGRPTCGPA